MTRHQRTFNVACFALVFAIICVVFGTLVSGCTTQKKVQKWNDKHQVKAAAYCATRFPPIEWTRERVDTLLDTITITQPLYVFDTLYVEGDTVVLKTKCPPSQTITKTVTKEKEVRVRDSALTVLLQGNIEQLEGISADKDKEIAIAKDRLGEAKKSRNWWMWAALLTWGVIALYVVLKMRTKLPI
jgi:hypothetical protein